MLVKMYDVVLTVVWSSCPHATTVSLNFGCITARNLPNMARSKRFMIIHKGGGGGSKCDIIKRGGGEDYCDGSVTEGGEGVQNSLNLCDVIYERPQ